MLTPVASMASVLEGDCVLVRVGQLELLVGMTEGQYFAVSARCPHAEQSLHSGRLRGFEISCPLHGARFDVRTGQCTRGPASSGLNSYSVLIENGKLCVDL